MDNDTDGWSDFDPATFADPTRGMGDPGCKSPTYFAENPQCDDDVNNDGAFGIDWDGGSGGGPVDPQCSGVPWKNRERRRCGLRFVSEPGYALLLTAGLGALVLAGRRRMRK